MPRSFYVKTQQLRGRERLAMLPACDMLLSAGFSRKRMPIKLPFLESMARPCNTEDTQVAPVIPEALWLAVGGARLGCANLSVTRDRSVFSIYAKGLPATLQGRESLFVSFRQTDPRSMGRTHSMGFLRARALPASPRLLVSTDLGSQLLTLTSKKLELSVIIGKMKLEK